jgi:hypothetical protein
MMGGRSTLGKENRYTPEQIVRMLRAAEVKLSAGTTLPEVTGELEISEATFLRGTNWYDGMQTDVVKHLR